MLTTTVIKLTVISIWTAISTGWGGTGGCLRGIYFAEEEVCITFLQTEQSWNDARNECQEESGDLVQIWSEKKERFIKGLLVGTNTQHWIGVSDQDRDGTYEYTNGSKLNTSSPGLGKWSDETWNEPGKEEQCVTIQEHASGLESHPCNSMKKSICEKHRSNTENRRARKMICEYCFCYPEHWSYLRHVNKYINVFKGNRNYSRSAYICDRHGGQLLTVRDSETEMAIKAAIQWNPTGVLYWMGLAVKDHVFTWSDGSILGVDDYQKWFYRPNLSDYCVGVVWDYEAKWRAVDCKSEEFYICEAQDPCNVVPVLSVDDVIIKDNTKADVRSGSKISCFFHGVPEDVLEVRFNCGMHKSESRNGSSAHLTAHFEMDLHKKSCVCHVILVGGSEKKTQFTVYYKTPPQLVNQNDNNTFVMIEEGARMTLTFNIYAYPAPTSHNLTQQGYESSPENYRVTIHQLKEAMQHTVDIALDEYALGQDGTYILALENGVGKRLKYVFYVQEVREAKATSGFINNLTYFGVIWTMLIVGIIAGIVMLFLKMRGTGESQSQVKKKSKEESYSSLEFETEPQGEDDNLKEEPKEQEEIPTTNPINQ